MTTIVENIYNSDGTVETIYLEPAVLTFAETVISSSTLEEAKEVARDILTSFENLGQ